jgi:2-hydroxychromene-2-carboxylate isomerase
MTRTAGDVYFSFASPYAWRAAAALASGLPLQWHPFWDPAEAAIRDELAERGASVVYTPMPFQKVLYGLHEMRRRAARERRSVALPRDRSAYWDVAHLAFLDARRQGAGGAFLQRAFAARWEEGRDITRVETLAALFHELELDTRALPSLTADRGLCREAAEALGRAYRLGIFGVPSFVCRQRCYWGVDRMDDFLSDLNGAWQRSDALAAVASGAEAAVGEPAEAVGAYSIPDPPPEVIESVGMYDYDHPGGCG